MTPSSAAVARVTGPEVRPDAVLLRKAEHLDSLLRALPSVVVAYSGGVDSAFLAHAASRVCPGPVLCVTADSASYPRRHREMAERTAAAFDFVHEFIQTAEMERPAYRANAEDRCYHCKRELHEHLTRIARDRGYAAVVDGNNADDRGDYRPGRRAARELGVRSPLDEADLTKAEIRELARRAGLPCWDEPASACLSSRIPYFRDVTPEKLATIERAEDALRALGFRVCRVRHHDDLARVELGSDELPRAIEPAMAKAIVDAVRGAGYTYVTLDPRGYRSGSLNDVLRLTPI